MMKTVLPSNGFVTDAIQFEEARASESDGARCFKQSLCESVQVSRMVMWLMGSWTVGQARTHDARDSIEIIDLNERTIDPCWEKKSQKASPV
jgi:hypothetical protein